MSEQLRDEKHLLDANNIIIIVNLPWKPAHAFPTPGKQLCAAAVGTLSITLSQTLNPTLFHTSVFPHSTFEPTLLENSPKHLWP